MHKYKFKSFDIEKEWKKILTKNSKTKTVET